MIHFCALALAGFLSAMDDVPLPATLSERQGAGFSFDSQAGLILAAEAEGATSAEAVLSFYEESMPALGWTRSDRVPQGYVRGGDMLTISAEETAGRIVVRYRLIAPSARPINHDAAN